MARRFLLNVVVTGIQRSILRNTLIGSFLLAAAYMYAPESGGDVYLTRWIALYTPPCDLWTELASVSLSTVEGDSHIPFKPDNLSELLFSTGRSNKSCLS